LHNACIIHDWGNNLITIEGSGTLQPIIVTKHLDSNNKHPKVLLCYDLMEGVTNKKEVLLATKPNLFTIETITLPKLEIFNAAIFTVKINIEDFTFNFPHSQGQIRVHNTPMHIRCQELDIEH
jgi:hypothetical protein